MCVRILYIQDQIQGANRRILRTYGHHTGRHTRMHMPVRH